MAFTVHYENPDVMTQDNFLTDEECDHFIKLATPNLERAQVSSNKTGQVSQGRTGKNCWITHNQDEVTKRVAKRIADEVGIPISHAEAYQIIYYDESQEYRAHCDGWDHDNSEKAIRCMRLGGQRMTTALCYLNTVIKGGHTRMTKLDINVTAEKGKLLIFSNVYKDTNVRHPLSEHAGTPPLEGKKWAFNLWFRELPKNEQYFKNGLPKVLTPLTPHKPNAHFSEKNNNNKEQYNKEKILKTYNMNNIYMENQTIVSEDPKILTFQNCFSSDDIVQLMLLSKFNNTEARSVCWIPNENIPTVVSKISKLIGINSEFFENICLTKYFPDNVHNNHYDAYDINTPAGISNTESRGQRLYSVIGFLTDATSVQFTDLNINLTPNSGDFLFYNNTEENGINRHPKMRNRLENSNTNGAVVLSLYVREHSVTKDKKLTTDLKSQTSNINWELKPINTIPTEGGASTSLTTSKSEPTSLVSKEPPAEDYEQTLKEVYEKFEDGTMTPGGHKSMNFMNKVKWEEVCESAKELYALRKSAPLLDQDSFKQEFTFDEFTPVCHDKAFTPEAAEFFRQYFRKHLADGSYVLGDRQSKLRYKGNDESLSRLLHYELLPLIEHITQKKLRPTYTYMAGYLKGGDLPAHTDRADCQYTVSVVLDKPDGANWTIYFDPTKSKEKNKGRVDIQPNKFECIACDADVGGLMMFNGEEHAHFREPLEHEFYTVVLCHYRRVEPQPQPLSPKSDDAVASSELSFDGDLVDLDEVADTDETQL